MRIGTAALLLVILHSGVAPPLAAHPLIDPDEADVLIRHIGELKKNDDPGDAYELGEQIARVTDIANHDLRNNQGELSLLGRLLLHALHTIGIELQYSNGLERYPLYRAPYQRYLQAFAGRADAAGQADARYRLLTADFYESFRFNPLQPLQPDWALLQERISEVEDFLEDFPQYSAAEELQFIDAVYKSRAALEAGDAASAGTYGRQARQALQSFRARYPDSIRAAAVSTLLQTLPLFQ